MINNSQYTKLIQYLSILGGGIAPPLPPGSDAYVMLYLLWGRHRCFCSTKKYSHFMIFFTFTESIDKQQPLVNLL